MWFTGDSNPDNRHRPLLRVRRERPCDCRAAERRDKLTADYHVLRNDVALDLCAALISSDRRRCSALSNSLTRPLRSAISFIRPRARMLSSATEPTHDSETADCRSRSNKKHQRGKGKQAGGQCQSSVARQCCDQDWKKEKGERGNAETLQKLTQVFDMLSHYAIAAARAPALLRRPQSYQAHSPPTVVTGRPSTRLDRESVLRCGRGPDAVEELLVYRIVRVESQHDRIEIAECHSIDVFGRCNDELISDLTSS